MNVTLISCFRNATGYIERYFDQLTDLINELQDRGDWIYVIWGEGDSTDDTKAKLAYNTVWSTDALIRDVDCTHGGADYGSVVNTERFRQLAHVGNCMWAHIPQDADAVVYVESDLIWEPEAILTLIDRLQDYPAISPMVYLRRQGFGQNAFYDVWAGRKDGKHFSHYPPYCDGFDPDKPFQVDSMGSCMAIRGTLAKGLIWDEQVFVGICRQLKEQGYGIWIDPTVAVYHT
jgi:hypothetical protein